MDNNDSAPKNQPPLTDPNELKELTPDEIKKHQEKQPPKVAEVERYKIVAMMMMGGTSKKFPKFPRRFHALRDSKGVKQYVEESEGQVLTYVDPEMVTDAILNYSDDIGDKIYAMKHDQATKCFKRWASMYPKFDHEITPVRQKSKKGYCWHRLNFDVSDGDTPLFDEIMGRTTNKDAFQAWIGSLFDANSDRDQYVWLHGAGRNGKSTLGRMLSKIFAQTARYENVPSKHDKFWTSGLIGKRLIIFADCNEYQWVTSGVFKGLTGGDSTPIEIKNGPRYDAQLMCKFLFFSNDKPNISGSEADIRRAIYCEIDPIATFKPDREYEAKLWQEVPHIIRKCILLYHEKTANSVAIPLDEDNTMDDLIAANEEHYELFLHKHFEVKEEDPDEYEKQKSELCTPGQLKDAFEKERIPRREQRYYRRYLESKGHKRRRYNKKEGGEIVDQVWRYSKLSARITSELDHKTDVD